MREEVATLQSVGVATTPLEQVALTVLRKYRDYLHYDDIIEVDSTPSDRK